MTVRASERRLLFRVEERSIREKYVKGTCATLLAATFRGERMRKSVIASLFLVVVLGLPLVGCQDTKARQENDQLKAQVAELQKENADLSSKVDGLAKENSALASENEKLKAAKASKPPKKSSKSERKRRRTVSS